MGIETTITCDVCGVSALGEREAFPARTYCPACDAKRATTRESDETIGLLQADLRTCKRSRDAAIADADRLHANFAERTRKLTEERDKLCEELAAAEALMRVQRERDEARRAQASKQESDPLDGAIRRALEVALRERRE